MLGFCIILSMYGGGFATVPAYLADMFGTQFVGAIHGRLLTAWSTAGIIGPVVVNYLREFQLAAGVPRDHLYNCTMYILCGMLIAGLICNYPGQACRPKWHMSDDEVAKLQAAGADKAAGVRAGRSASAKAAWMQGRAVLAVCRHSAGLGRLEDARKRGQDLLIRHLVSRNANRRFATPLLHKQSRIHPRGISNASISTCLVAVLLVTGSLHSASAQTSEAKPSKMKLTMAKLKEMKAKWAMNRPKLKVCRIEAKKQGT